MRSKKRVGSTRLAVEQLESRQMLAASALHQAVAVSVPSVPHVAVPAISASPMLQKSMKAAETIAPAQTDERKLATPTDNRRNQNVRAEHPKRPRATFSSQSSTPTKITRKPCLSTTLTIILSG